MKFILLIGLCVAIVSATQITNSGYTACDQAEACGVPFNFVDIRGTGTQLFGGPGTPLGHTSGGSPVSLAQAFSLFGGSYTTAIVGYGGFLSLGPPILNASDLSFTAPVNDFTPARSIPVLTNGYGFETAGDGAWHQYFAGGAGPFTNPTEVFQWRGRNHLCTSNCKVAEIEVLLDLVSGSILMQYQMAVATGVAGEGGGASGIRGVAPGEYLQWAAGLAGFSSDPFTTVPMPSNVCYFQAGASCGTSLDSGAVPEPSSFLLAAGALGAMLWRRTRG